MRVYQEITDDHGYRKAYFASDNDAIYYMTSARAHDMMFDFFDKYHRDPTSRWLNKYFRFERIK